MVLSLATLSACAKNDGAGTTDSTASASATASGSPYIATNPNTPEEKIRNAMSAAPDSVARAATVMDWPAAEGGKSTQLRAGTNGWVCYPSTPAAKGALGEDPICLDAQFQRWAQALMAKKPPKLAGVAIAYMFQGDRGASVTDPFAESGEKTKDWVVAGPHIMVATPNVASLSALPGVPSNGVPWVMWQGTPYAHIMVPVAR